MLWEEGDPTSQYLELAVICSISDIEAKDYFRVFLFLLPQALQHVAHAAWERHDSPARLWHCVDVLYSRMVFML